MTVVLLFMLYNCRAVYLYMTDWWWIKANRIITNTFIHSFPSIKWNKNRKKSVLKSSINSIPAFSRVNEAEWCRVDGIVRWNSKQRPTMRQSRSFFHRHPQHSQSLYIHKNTNRTVFSSLFCIFVFHFSGLFGLWWDSSSLLAYTERSIGYTKSDIEYLNGVSSLLFLYRFFFFFLFPFFRCSSLIQLETIICSFVFLFVCLYCSQLTVGWLVETVPDANRWWVINKMKWKC